MKKIPTLDEITARRNVEALPTKVKPPTSKATGPNPKDIVGQKKISITKIPPIALLHCAHAMMDGARKYDPYNWRAKDIMMTGYLDAAIRHIFDVLEGEEVAPDSLCLHLGHAMATLAIVIDAAAVGSLIDDRPITDRSRGAIARAREGILARIKEREERDAALKVLPDNIAKDGIIKPIRRKR